MTLGVLLQIARLEGQKASLEAEIKEVSEESAALLAEVERLQAELVEAQRAAAAAAEAAAEATMAVQAIDSGLEARLAELRTALEVSSAAGVPCLDKSPVTSAIGFRLKLCVPT